MLAELKDGHVNLSASHDMTRYWQWQDDYPANFDPIIINIIWGRIWYCIRYAVQDSGR